MSYVSENLSTFDTMLTQFWGVVQSQRFRHGKASATPYAREPLPSAKNRPPARIVKEIDRQKKTIAAWRTSINGLALVVQAQRFDLLTPNTPGRFDLRVNLGHEAPTKTPREQTFYLCTTPDNTYVGPPVPRYLSHLLQLKSDEALIERVAAITSSPPDYAFQSGQHSIIGESGNIIGEIAANNKFADGVASRGIGFAIGGLFELDVYLTESGDGSPQLQKFLYMPESVDPITDPDAISERSLAQAIRSGQSILQHAVVTVGMQLPE